jgi:hypothetical protein
MLMMLGYALFLNKWLCLEMGDTLQKLQFHGEKTDNKPSKFWVMW